MKNKFDLYEEYIQSALPYGYIITSGNIKYIYTKRSVWKIHLNDKERFGQWTLFHRSNTSSDRDDNTYWHCQMRFRSMYYALFYCFIHDEFKSRGLRMVEDDYKKFSEKFEYYYGLNLIKEYFDKETVES